MYHPRMTTRCALLILSLSQVVAAPAQAREPPARAAAKLIEALRKLEGSATPCAGLTASYGDGSGFHGWTHVQLADGKVSVEHTKRGQRPDQGLRLAGAAQANECKALLRAALKGRLWRVRSKRKVGVPDETRPSVSVAVAGAGSFDVTLWANEARKDRDFAAVQQALLAIAKRLSGGKVTY